jgi:hypothetical protein
MVLPAAYGNNVKFFTNFSCRRGARLLNNTLNFAGGMPMEVFTVFYFFCSSDFS